METERLHKMVDGEKVWLTEEEENALRAKWEKRATQEAAIQYQHDRRNAYASIGDQMDMHFWDTLNGTRTWQDHILSVKNKFPKPA